MDVIKAPTKIMHPVYEAEIRYTPIPGTKAKEISGFTDTGTRIKIIPGAVPYVKADVI